MFTICLRYVYDMITICLRYVYDMCGICAHKFATRAISWQILHSQAETTSGEIVNNGLILVDEARFEPE
jgi:hypothetical protein